MITARRLKDDVGICTSPADIAAAAVAAAEAKIRADRRAAVESWRSLVVGIADGEEPDGAGLRRIAELLAVLDLPPGSLALHVAAVQQDRQLVGIVDAAEQTATAALAAMPSLEAELQAARQRVRDLQAAVTRAEFEQMSGVHVRSRIASHRSTHPVLFADLDAVEV